MKTTAKLDDDREVNDQDAVWLETTLSPRQGDTHHLMCFIPGNPCLAAFYRPFLSELFITLSRSLANVAVATSSLPGFESHPTGQQYSPNGLEQQVENVEKLINQCVHRCLETSDKGRQGNLKVMLVGHSVGAYMILEALRRRAQSLSQLVDVHIAGAVLLFPTVTEIAQSQQGSMMKRLCNIPYFPALASGLVKTLLYPISTEQLSWCISHLVGHPTHTGDAVAAWLKSPNAVYSTFHLLIDELAMIKKDTWTDTVWGSSSDIPSEKAGSRTSAVPLRFYFGKNDVWVQNDARDQLIATRGRVRGDTTEQWRPLMLIDDKSIPHDFIVEHNKVVAEIAADLILELFSGDPTYEGEDCWVIPRGHPDNDRDPLVGCKIGRSTFSWEPGHSALFWPDRDSSKLFAPQLWELLPENLYRSL